MDKVRLSTLSRVVEERSLGKFRRVDGVAVVAVYVAVCILVIVAVLEVADVADNM
jgi:hypothetical protein